jgi:predicted transcriptional regulator
VIESPPVSRKKNWRLAGIRFEALCRIETGKQTPSVPTVDKIDRALVRAERRKNEHLRGRMVST